MVGNLALVSRKTRFDVTSIWKNGDLSDAHFNELTPPLLSVSTLHPVFVELT